MDTDGIRPAQFHKSFTRREVEILHLMKEGLSNHAIAQKLFLTLGTVKWYNKQIFGKLDVENRTQAIEKAIRIGLIEPWGGVQLAQEIKVWSAARPRHNLPAPLTAFIGRRKECTELRVLLHSSSTRLVTILGAGGIGKTRLALHVAEEAFPLFSHGVWVVDLAPTEEPARVPQIVANALGIQDSGGLPYEEVLVHYLYSRSLLLVLDNCEHLIDACARLVTLLLTSCPKLHILATSREALEVEGEAHYPLSSLTFPDSLRLPALNQLRRYDAVQLFVDRAGLVCPGFALNAKNGPAVAQICRKLDGIPLALELAAARANLLSVEQIAERLEDCLHLLATAGRTAIPRHKTVRACLDWSYNLLPKSERVLLSRLAVFAGGCSLEAAEVVCGGCEGGFTIPPREILDLLSQLVNHSMVISVVNALQPGDESRYRLLEPIRQYALEKLEQAGELMKVRDRHLAWFVGLAERTAPVPFWSQHPGQGRLFDHDVNNLRNALGWALADPASPRVVDALRLACALEGFWHQTHMYHDCFSWVSRSLALSTSWGLRDKTLHALALELCGVMESINSHVKESRPLLEESVAMFREIGDDRHLSKALADLTMFTNMSSDYDFLDLSMGPIEESIALARRVGAPAVIGYALRAKVFIERINQNLEGANRDAQQGFNLLQEVGDLGSACYLLAELGFVAMERGEIDLAIQYYEEYWHYRPENEDMGLYHYASPFLFFACYHKGDYKRMEEIAQDLLDSIPEQHAGAKIVSLFGLGFALKGQGDYRRAALCFYELMLAAQAVKDKHGVYTALGGLAGTAASLHQPVRAARMYGLVEKLLESSSRHADPIERHEFSKDVVILRKALSPEAFSETWNEGRLLDIDDAFKEGRAVVENLVGSWKI